MDDNHTEQCLERLTLLGLKVVAGPHYKFLPGKGRRADLHLIRVKATITQRFAREKLGMDPKVASTIKQGSPTSLRFIVEFLDGDVNRLKYVSTSERKKEGAKRNPKTKRSRNKKRAPRKGSVNLPRKSE